MGCSCSALVPPAAAEQEIRAVVELYIGPELTADELTTLRDEKLQPLLDKYGHWQAQGHLEEECALLEARVERLQLLRHLVVLPHQLRVHVAALRAQLHAGWRAALVVNDTSY